MACNKAIGAEKYRRGIRQGEMCLAFEFARRNDFAGQGGTKEKKPTGESCILLLLGFRSHIQLVLN